MSTFIFDFKQNKSVLPLEGVTHFFINPYMYGSSWTSLRIGNKLNGIDADLVIQESTGLPLIILPLSILDLGKCMIKLNDDFSGRIINGRQTIYFKTTEQDHIIRIDSVV